MRCSKTLAEIIKGSVLKIFVLIRRKQKRIFNIVGPSLLHESKEDPSQVAPREEELSTVLKSTFI